MDRFREMETFVTVVEAGSFVGAADKLRISKSVASRIVQDLEERLGGRLLQRTTRRLSLTDAGRAYYERCAQILEELQEADEVVGLASAKVVGRIKVSSPVSFGTLYLADLWSRFLQNHPRITLDVSLDDRLVDLVGEGFDLAVRITSRQEDTSLIARKLARSRMVMCASPDYLARNGSPGSPEALAGHQFVGYSYWPTGDTLRLESPLGAGLFKTQPRLRVNNGDTCRAAALAHLGIIFQPAFIVSADLRQGRLVELLPEWHTEEIHIYAVYPTRRLLSAKVRALVEFLAEAMKNAEWNLTPDP
jgi:DNA-binding transcriptional LysR family regulator